MTPKAIITTHVINTINSLPADERKAIVTALASEILMGEEPPTDNLSPMENMIYSMIRSYVRRDTERFARGTPSEAATTSDSFRPAAAI